MNERKTAIYSDVKKLIDHHGTRNPRTILEERNVTLIALRKAQNF
ncbi:hypothetical protein [Dolosigranulum pigrum]|nr:hypothetical protein [Dolosigranulum pigrum]